MIIQHIWYKINKNGVIGYVANKIGENWIDYINSKNLTPNL